MRKIYVFILVLLITLVAILAGRCVSLSRRQPTVIHQIDTIHRIDTFVYERPIFITQRIVDTVHRAMVIEQHDTVWLPRVQKVYEDSTYRAVVSGYDPQLDSISVYQRTITIHEITTYKVPEAKRWGLGLQAGYGATIVANKAYFTPYVGIGISYNLIRF